MTPIEILYLAAPVLLKALVPRSSVIDWTVVLAIWLPVEFGLIERIFFPVASAATLVGIYQFRWPVAQPWKIGWRWRVGVPDLTSAILGLVFLVFLLVPTGFLLGFIRWSPKAIPIQNVAAICVFALIEEILFRGVIQNLVEKQTRDTMLALAITSVVFGFAHLNNQTALWITPNWRYVLMATIAGFAYGAVWIKTRNVIASTLTHSAVNLLWKVCFT